MDWTAKLDQQHDALMRVFYMLVSAALMVVRTGLDVRNVPASFSFTPYDSPPLDNENLSPAQCDRLDQLYAEAMALICAAQAVARRLASTRREIYELMKQLDALARSLRGQTAQDLIRQNQACAAAERRAQARDPPDTS